MIAVEHLNDHAVEPGDGGHFENSSTIRGHQPRVADRFRGLTRFSVPLIVRPHPRQIRLWRSWAGRAATRHGRRGDASPARARARSGSTWSSSFSTSLSIRGCFHTQGRDPGGSSSSPGSTWSSRSILPSVVAMFVLVSRGEPPSSGLREKRKLVSNIAAMFPMGLCLVHPARPGRAGRESRILCQEARTLWLQAS